MKGSYLEPPITQKEKKRREEKRREEKRREEKRSAKKNSINLYDYFQMINYEIEPAIIDLTK